MVKFDDGTTDFFTPMDIAPGEYPDTPNTTKPFPISACCNASTHLGGGIGDFSDKDRVVTQHYICDKCGKPCDLAEWNTPGIPVEDPDSRVPVDASNRDEELREHLWKIRRAYKFDGMWSFYIEELEALIHQREQALLERVGDQLLDNSIALTDEQTAVTWDAIHDVITAIKSNLVKENE